MPKLTLPSRPASPLLAAVRRGGRVRHTGLAIGLALALTSLVQALSVRQFDLESLCAAAHQIVRGEVVEVRRGSVAVGGGMLPTVTYRLRVTEALAGQAYGHFEFTCLAPVKRVAQGGAVRFANLAEQPALEQGQEYLLFTTRPSRVGLSSMVGLGQGCFRFQSKAGKELVVNERGNAGLGLPQAGAIEYDLLATQIRSLLTK